MVYVAAAGLLFAALFGISVYPLNPALAVPIAGIAGLLTAASIYLPRLFWHYTVQDAAPTVLSRLVQRAVSGTILDLIIALTAPLLAGAWSNPVFLGEVYVYALMGVFLFQGIGEVMTNHVIYLQQTHQYNSNQLFAALLGLALLLFVLILFFLAFDLAQPPSWHNYVRDMLAITLALAGYGRAVFLMAHH